MKNINATLHAHMCARYTALAATHNYVFTFTYVGNFYALFLNEVNAAQLQLLTKLDKASRNAGMAIRFKPTNRDKFTLVNMGARVVCSKVYFDELVASCKYNRGEVAEMLITEQVFGQTWHKDSVPFTVDGDINADGVKWQHKHESATFCNERTLHNLTK